MRWSAFGQCCGPWLPSHSPVTVAIVRTHVRSADEEDTANGKLVVPCRMAAKCFTASSPLMVLPPALFCFSTSWTQLLTQMKLMAHG